MRGRLNSFQRTILQWNDMYPYSAIHVVRVPGVLSEEHLRTAIQATLQARGLTNLTLDRETCGYEYQGGPTALELTTIAGGEDPPNALFAEMKRQLNAPFSQGGQFNPFRFFVVSAADSFFLGLVYFHVAADAESIVLLLKLLRDACLRQSPPALSNPLNLYPDSRAHLIPRHPKVVAGRLLAFPAQVRDLRESHRPRYRDAQNMENGLCFFAVEPESWSSLVTAAKSWDVTVNDLLMAFLLKSLAPFAARRKGARRRRKISASCIVNLRRDIGIDNRQTFGLFLGSFTITHEVPDGISVSQLASDIRKQTLAIKRNKLYLGTPLELGFARFMLRFFSPGQRKKFYQKNYPLWGGITNINLNSLWDQQNDAGPPDYFRCVSTGPVTPLVLSVTTVGTRANIAVSYRSTVFSTEDIEAFKCRFRNHFEQLKQPS